MSIYVREERNKVYPKKRKEPVHRVPDPAPYSQPTREGNEAMPITGMFGGGSKVDKEEKQTEKQTENETK